MNTAFHRTLSIQIDRKDLAGANRVVMQELGRIGVHHRADFVDLLNNTDVPAHADMADAELLKLYFDNIHKKELLVGSAFLVNVHNKTIGFDGDSEVSDEGVKKTYKIMTSAFIGGHSRNSEHIQAHRRDWTHHEPTSGFIWDTIAKGAVGISGKVIDGQNKKKYGAVDALAAQQKAKSDMAQAMISQRQSQIDAAKKAQESKAKNLKIGLIVGGSVIGLAVIGLIIYKMKKK